MRKLPILFLILLSGCSTVGLSDFERGGQDDEQFRRDLAACDMEGAHYEGENAWTKTGRYNRMVTSCMRAKGHTRKE